MLRYIPLLVAVLVIGFTSWASIPSFGYPLGGYSQADISNMYPTAITPAGFTFSIWSLIYLSWLIAGVYIARLPLTSLTQKLFGKIPFFSKGETVSDKALIGFSLAMALTAVWLIPWGNNMIGLALIIMLVLLASLKYTFFQTRNVPLAFRSSVELFLGWINIATVANITVWFVSLGFTGGNIPVQIWAVGVLGLACILTLFYQLRYGTYIISLVFLWTMLGEWVAHPDMTQRFGVVVYAILVIVAMAYSYAKKTR